MTHVRAPRSVRRRLRAVQFAAATAAAGGVLTVAPRVASAQVTTFKLDRLEVPGAPDDGLVIFRPVTQPKPIFFGQVGLGYTLNPLHTSNITTDQTTLRQSSTGVVKDQLTFYPVLGFEFLNRFIVAMGLPVTPWQVVDNPNYPGGGVVTGSKASTVVSQSSAAADDMRFDLRAVLYRTPNEKGAIAANLSLFAPTGTQSAFGGDGQTTALLGIGAEYDRRLFILDANTGIDFRPRSSINDPVNNTVLGVANEWRWAVGAFVPLKGGKYRLGGTVFGQTGLSKDTTIIGDTIFTKRNTPVEWNIEGRMKFGAKERWWATAGGGSLIGNGYGAPDLRLIAAVGAYLPIMDTDAQSPDRKAAMREKWRSEHTGDADNDGIPDDLDACPTEPEDHQGSDPNDGCPVPPDKDGDGIPDMYDKCPDQPEDKDGIQDADGCPEDDADQDGVPDAQDACPREPGKPSPDPKKNGCPIFIQKDEGVVRVLQQVHFATGKADILPDSFPMLNEIAQLLKVNPGIKKMSIEGHTDNKGSADLNKTLSQKRADSVMKYLVDHGVEQGRLEAHGYGMERPIESNDTDKGRAANRRVEFKITDEDDASKGKK